MSLSKEIEMNDYFFYKSLINFKFLMNLDILIKKILKMLFYWMFKMIFNFV